MQPVIILAECLETLAKIEKAAVNDAAFRKQVRILIADPGIKYALSHARDAPATKKRTLKAKPVD